ncbi:putative sodium-coupled neutral amino acid transporter 10 [Mustelus asterias]
MTASNWGYIMNVVNSIVGVSVLTMPFCFKQCGIALGVVLLLFCSWMTHQSCMFLVKAANTSKRRTYPGLAFHAYGKAGKMLVETSLIGLMLGTCIAFYVVIADLGSNFFAQLLGLQATQGFRVFLLFAVSVFIVLPLSLQRNMMASIQSFSAMALIFYTLFMFVVVLSSFKHGLFNGQWLSRVSYIRWEGIFQCIPIYGMSFACQSQVLPTYDSLDEPSVKRMSTIFTSSLNVVNMFYITVGSFGYIGYTDNIAGNVMMNFPSNLVTEMIRVGFMMSVAVGFPMMILPCRQALNTFLFEQLQQKDGTFAAGGYMPPLRFKLITAGIVFGTMLGGILIPNVETILGLTGATMGSLICFVCPALIYRKIQKNGFTSQIILWVGLVILVISTFTTLTATSEQPVTPEKPPQDIDHEKLQNEMDQQQKISVQNSVLKEAGDDRDRPKLDKDAVEQPQIKVPIEPPEERNEKDEVQLDRPDQGVAHPVGEAHRHEPPIPHDKVIVDEGKDGDESNEEKLPAIKDKQPNDGKQEVKNNFNEKIKELEEEKMVNAGLKEQGKGVESHINDAGNAPEIDSKQKGQPGKMEPEVHVQGAVPLQGGELQQQKLNDNRGKVPGEEDSVIHNAEGNVENIKNKELENGNKRDLPALENVGAAEVPQAHVRDERDSENAILEEKQDGKPAEGGEDDEKHMDHIVLLNVIKEQQEQQKRLLDQQEKLLAVIQEQHKEIHQQRVDDEDKGQQDDENSVKKLTGEEKDDHVKNVDSVNGQKPNVINADSRGDAGQDLPVADHNKDGVEPKGALQGARGNGLESQNQARDSKQNGEIGVNVEAHQISPQNRDKFKGVVQKVDAPDLLPKGRDGERVVPQPDAVVPKAAVPHDEGAKAAQEHGFKNANVPLEKEVKVQREGPNAGNRNANVPDNEAKVPKVSEDLGIKAKSKDEVHKIESEIENKPLKAEHVEKVGSDEKVKAGDRGAFQENPNLPGGHVEDRNKKIHLLMGAGKVPKNRGENLIDRAQERDERQIEEDPMKSQRKEKVLDKNNDLQHVDPNAPLKHKEKNPSQKNGEPYKDLKLDGGGDLRRRKRDLRSSMDESQQDDSGRLIISLDPVPNFKTDNLRSALESQLKQVGGASFQIVQSRKIKQVTDTEKDT